MHDYRWWSLLARRLVRLLGFGRSNDNDDLPDAVSPDLQLDHPTEKEKARTWELTSETWKDALTVPQYLEESSYLAAVPLAKEGGMTHWILVDKTSARDHRAVLASCETFRKRSLVSDVEGNVTESLTHGIASVFCGPRYRRRGYASRLMRELSTTLPHWQTGYTTTAGSSAPVVASVLFSDIGRRFYAALGWQPFPSRHIEYAPVPAVADEADEADEAEQGVDGPAHTVVAAQQVGDLCEEDEAMCRRDMARPCGHDGKKTRFMILPDHDHMLWHHRKEEFVCDRLFGEQPLIKGAIAGKPGNRVWAIWVHRFYGSPDDRPSGNTLYILRLVVENQALRRESYSCTMTDGVSFSTNMHSDLPVRELKAVIQAAQAEAAAWNLQQVVLWGSTPQIEELTRQTGIQHRRNDRKKEGICCLQWLMDGTGHADSVDWIGKEKYGWC